MLKITRARRLLSMGYISEKPTVEWRMKDLTAQDVDTHLRKARQLAASLCASPALHSRCRREGITIEEALLNVTAVNTAQ
jgi:hypothetical protein